MTIEADEQFLTGLLWIATSQTDGKPSRFEQAEAIGRGVGSLRRAGVPEALVADAYRSHLRSTVALQAVTRWANWERPRQKWESAASVGHRSHGVLALLGPVGSGKSAAMAKLVGWRVESGLWQARWVDCRSLASGGWDKVNALEHLVDTPCLCLDDLSAATAEREAARTAILALLGQRHEKRLLTIITSNLGAGDLEAVTDAALWSRIGQTGEVVYCPGEDLRASVEAVELSAVVAEADRLVQLVRRLDRRQGSISDEVLALPRDEAVRQLGRLLGVTRGQARAAAAEVDAHDERCAVLAAELEAKIAGSMRLVAANEGPGDTEKEAARAASKARAIELLEQGEDESPAEVAERKCIAANLEREAKRR
jgi:hypothetical protein